MPELPPPCPSCQKPIHPVQELDAATMRLVPRCSGCGANPEAIAEGIARGVEAALGGAANDDDGSDAAPPVVMRPPIAVALPRPPPNARQPATAAPATPTLLEMLKAQAVDLEARIPSPKRLAAMKAALKSLKLAIAAEESE